MTEQMEQLEDMVTKKAIKIKEMVDLVDAIIDLLNFGDIPYLELRQMPILSTVTLNDECALVRQIRPTSVKNKEITMQKEWFAKHLPFWKKKRKKVSKFSIGHKFLREYSVDNHGNSTDFCLSNSKEAHQVLLHALDEKGCLLHSYMNGLMAISNLLLMGDVPFDEITQMPSFQKMNFEREKNICGELIMLLKGEGKLEISEKEKKNAVAISNIKKMLESEYGMKNL